MLEFELWIDTWQDIAAPPGAPVMGAPSGSVHTQCVKAGVKASVKAACQVAQYNRFAVRVSYKDVEEASQYSGPYTPGVTSANEAIDRSGTTRTKL